MFFWKNLVGRHEVINMLSFFPFAEAVNVQYEYYVCMDLWSCVRGYIWRGEQWNYSKGKKEQHEETKEEKPKGGSAWQAAGGIDTAVHLFS